MDTNNVFTQYLRKYEARRAERALKMQAALAQMEAHFYPDPSIARDKRPMTAPQPERRFDPFGPEYVVTSGGELIPAPAAPSGRAMPHWSERSSTEAAPAGGLSRRWVR